MQKSTPPLYLRINKLFETNRAADEPEESNDAVAAALTETLGRRVSGMDLAELRNESSSRFADGELVQALAVYFEAPASYLAARWDAIAERYDSELSVLTQLRDSGVQLLAMRDGGETSAADLLTILAQLPEQPKSTEANAGGTRSNV